MDNVHGARSLHGSRRQRRVIAHRSRSLVMTIGAAIALSGLTANLAAETYSWSNPVGGLFTDPKNWSPSGGPPGPIDSAAFSLGSAYAVHLEAPWTTLALRVGHDDVTLDLAGQTCQLAAAAANLALGVALYQDEIGRLTIGHGTMDLSTVGSGFMDVGRVGQGALIVQNAMLLSSQATIGSGLGNGAVTIGPAATWSNPGSIIVGSVGQGSALVLPGGSVDCGVAIVAQAADAIGALTVTGPRAVFACPDGVLTIGQAGLGAMTVASGGTVVAGVTSISGLVGGVGVASLSGAGTLLDSSSIGLYVGNGGSGHLQIESGARASGGFLSIGAENASTGHVIVTDPGSSVAAQDGWFTIGGHGLGTLALSGGAKADCQFAALGQFVGGDGEVTVAGAGSAWTVQAWCDVGREGRGEVLLQDGGTAAAAGPVRIAAMAGSHGRAAITGATSAWSIDGQLVAGQAGTGSLEVSAGASLNCASMIIGELAGGSGDVTVHGTDNDAQPSALNCAASLSIGSAGTATMTVADGAHITTPLVTVGPSGELAGDGVVNAAVVNGGRVAPGAALGRLAINGSYTQLADAVLAIELHGSAPGVGYDQLQIDGPVVLAGALQVTVADGFQPAPGQAFTIISTPGGSRKIPPLLSGAFDVVALPVPLNVIYGPDSVKLIVPCGRCLGDLNQTCSVNGLDLAIILGSWTGSRLVDPCPPSPGADLNGDCRVNGLDLALLLGQWGPCK